MPLTKRQLQILEYLRDYIQTRGYSPSMEEIASHFDLASLNGVYKHLNILEEKGFISRLSNRARSIHLTESAESGEAALPLLGVVAAGQPIEAVSDPEEISVPQSFLSRKECYVLRVEGDSMIDEHIADGDLVIVERRERAENGDLVVALVNGENTTLKKYYREGSRIRLQPANERLDPLFVQEGELTVQGVVVGLLRRYGSR